MNTRSISYSVFTGKGTVGSNLCNLLMESIKLSKLSPVGGDYWMGVTMSRFVYKEKEQ